MTGIRFALTGISARGAFLWPALIGLLILMLASAGCGGEPERETAAPAAKKAADAAPEALESYKIKDSSGEEICRVKKMGPARWTARLRGKKYVLETGDDFRFKIPDGTQYKAKKKGDKLKLKHGDKVLVELKFYDDKVKVTPDGGDTWQFKYKDDKVKVYKDDDEKGAVKFYADSGKLKAKDDDDKEIAGAKGFKRVSAALAPFLMDDDLPEAHRVFLVLVFMAMNR